MTSKAKHHRTRRTRRRPHCGARTRPLAHDAVADGPRSRDGCAGMARQNSDSQAKLPIAPSARERSRRNVLEARASPSARSSLPPTPLRRLCNSRTPPVSRRRTTLDFGLPTTPIAGHNTAEEDVRVFLSIPSSYKAQEAATAVPARVPVLTGAKPLQSRNCAAVPGVTS